MGILKTPTAETKPPEDYSTNSPRSNNLSQHAMMNPLSEDTAEVRQNLLNKRSLEQTHQKASSKQQQQHRIGGPTRSGRCGLGSWLAHKSGGTHEHWGTVTVVNVVFYILCVAAIGCSVYLNYRQSFLEERLRYLHHLDERLTAVEARLETVFLPSKVGGGGGHHHRRRVSPAINGFFSTTEKEFRASSSLALNSDDEDEDSGEVADDETTVLLGSSGEEEEYEDMKSVVRQLSLQVQGIQRLRRDVSHLKLTRQQRQTAIEQSPEDMCSCPPGNCPPSRRRASCLISGSVWEMRVERLRSGTSESVLSWILRVLLGMMMVVVIWNGSVVVSRRRGRGRGGNCLAL